VFNTILKTSENLADYAAPFGALIAKLLGAE